VELPRRLNPRVAGIGRSATLAINERSLQLRSEGRDIVRLGLGQSPFPVPAGVVEALRRHADEKAYLPVEGLPALREAVSRYLFRTGGLEIAARQIIIGPGTKELMFLLQLVGDYDLLVPAPSWVSYAPQATIIGRRIRWLRTEDDDELRLTPDAIEAQCRAEPDRHRLLILNYPGNPTGTTYAADQLEAIADVARRYAILVLSDEIYSGLTFTGEHVSIARFYPEGTIISDGLSKWCGAGGWRLGAFAFPQQLDWLQAAIAATASETFSAVAAPIQYAAVTAFEGNAEIEQYLSRSRGLLSALMARCALRLRAAGATVPQPQGAFYLLPRFAEDTPRFSRDGRPATASELCRRLLDDTGVAILPGSDFGLPAGELNIRLAAVDFDGEAALAAMARLADDAEPGDAFVNDYCRPAMTGIERMCAWLAGEA